MKYLLKAKEIYLENEILKDASLFIQDGKIKEINPLSDVSNDTEIIDLSDSILTSGFIDIHVHGGNGFDTMDLTYKAINELSKFEIKQGVTSFCPTTVTTSLEKTKQAIIEVKTALKKGVEGAEIIGSFLEGPYITPEYKGAHPLEFIRDININEIKDLYETGNNTITSVAMAPEKNNALEAIKYLTNNGVSVRIGHSGATLKEAFDAINKGATIGIHTFNAMSPLNHREPGMVGAVMLNENIYAEVICDLIHVSPEAIKILVKTKGTDKVILITDCMMAGGLADGKYNLGELPVIVENHIARTETGALAGSTLDMITAIKNMTQNVGVSLFDAVKMATVNPAKAVGIFDKKGSINIGKDADLTAFDENFNIKCVISNGAIKFK